MNYKTFYMIISNTSKYKFSWRDVHSETYSLQFYLCTIEDYY